MTDKQPEALRLAKILEDHYFYSDTNEAAAELRRLYEENVQMREQRDELLAVLRMARENIDSSLQSMIETETHPVTGLVEHENALLAIESEQDLLNQIDAAIAKAGGAV